MFFAALAVIAVHVVDDSFVQPEPGTSAGDHSDGLDATREPTRGPEGRRSSS